jgi:hypothetical protein
VPGGKVIRFFVNVDKIGFNASDELIDLGIVVQMKAAVDLLLK